MNVFLPQSVNIKGKEYAIRTNFRDVLKIISAFNDPDLENGEKVYITLVIMFPDFDEIPRSDYEDAFKAAMEFIDHGVKGDDRPSPRVMDWEQDEGIMFPAINKVAGFETRQKKYIHWWTFIGYYMEITEGIFSQVLSLRLKRARGQKLEKYEREYWNANKAICVLKPKLSKEELEEREKLNAWLN